MDSVVLNIIPMIIRIILKTEYSYFSRTYIKHFPQLAICCFITLASINYEGLILVYAFQHSWRDASI